MTGRLTALVSAGALAMTVLVPASSALASQAQPAQRWLELKVARTGPAA